MITSTIGPLTSEQRENNLQLTPTEIAAQAHASHTAALPGGGAGVVDGGAVADEGGATIKAVALCT